MIRIENKDGVPHHTRVIDMDTGEDITVKLRVSTIQVVCEVDRPVKAVLIIYPGQIDIAAELLHIEPGPTE